jgi:hypothetical protein
MEGFEKYEIIGTDLLLTQNLFWEFKPYAKDCIIDWMLVNVDQGDRNKEKLELLITDDEVCEVLEISKGIRQQLIINTLDGDSYIFSCDKIHQTVRGYNDSELIKLVIQDKKIIQELETENDKHNKLLNGLNTFIDKEIERKKNLIDLVPNKDNSTVLKSKHYLDILSQIKNKINSISES